MRKTRQNWRLPANWVFVCYKKLTDENWNLTRRADKWSSILLVFIFILADAAAAHTHFSDNKFLSNSSRAHFLHMRNICSTFAGTYWMKWRKSVENQQHRGRGSAKWQNGVNELPFDGWRLHGERWSAANNPLYLWHEKHTAFNRHILNSCLLCDVCTYNVLLANLSPFLSSLSHLCASNF